VRRPYRVFRICISDISAADISAAEISAAEISAAEIGATEYCVLDLSPYKNCLLKARPCQIGILQVGPTERDTPGIYASKDRILSIDFEKKEIESRQIATGENQRTQVKLM
jgi:hypothetical protein